MILALRRVLLPPPPALPAVDAATASRDDERRWLLGGVDPAAVVPPAAPRERRWLLCGVVEPPGAAACWEPTRASFDLLRIRLALVSVSRVSELRQQRTSTDSACEGGVGGLYL